LLTTTDLLTGFKADSTISSFWLWRPQGISQGGEGGAQSGNRPQTPLYDAG